MYDVKPITSDKPTDCGATCLKMILDYYGTEVPLDQLIKECNTRLIGCTLKDVMEAGKLHGMEPHAFKTDDDGILHVDRPAIIFWKKKHFCVFCGIDDDGNIVICNPDRGRYRMSKSLFKAWYSGIALFNGVPEDVEGQEIIDVYEHISRGDFCAGAKEKHRRYDPMSFGEAYKEMRNGHKIRHKDFRGGYWAWENDTIMIHCADGTVLDIRQTPDVGYTFGFIADDAWSIVE